MIAIIVGTVVGTLLAILINTRYRAWRRSVAKRDKTKAGRLGEL
jgi:hypothetical protein